VSAHDLDRATPRGRLPSHPCRFFTSRSHRAMSAATGLQSHAANAAGNLGQRAQVPVLDSTKDERIGWVRT
jgi:hypothetical protein